MSGLGSYVLRALGWQRNNSSSPATRARKRTSKETVICVGCPNDYSVLDTVLEPGNYDVSFLSSIETAYSEIANARPSRVILCMRPDDEQSLRVLSMLSLDPRTSHIPVVTCVANAGGGFDQGVEDDGMSGRALRGHGVVMH